jgi:collagenase-like PrtC family protease
MATTTQKKKGFLYRNLRAAAIAEKLTRLVREAERAGIAVVVDADLMAIRLVPAEAEDLHASTYDTVRVHNACGGGSARVSGFAVNDGLS